MTADLDPDRRLALAYMPAAARPAVEALWRLDVTLGAVLTTGRDAMISRIRLAWWREALEKLDTAPAPAEPVLRALAALVVPNGIAGAELAAMEAGWAALLSGMELGPNEIESYAAARGGLLFGLTARLLGAEDPRLAAAGEQWALVDLARHSANQPDSAAALEAARARQVTGRWPSRLRPLSMLAALARRDLDRGPPWEIQGSPGRMWHMMRHRFSGT
jgi:phytoene synthase